MEHKLIEELHKNNLFLTTIFVKEKHESELYVAFMQKTKNTCAAKLQPIKEGLNCAIHSPNNLPACVVRWLR